ncbi:hypothetical protein F1188_04375 [Roseospira marina]|uniref:Uncharacterized protein n=1 Tax=Roseospira marina TaxID=140057 RepID=A0A5M6IFV9_9PROT|nr:hypothetical protein [Roseospira marina]KAA5607143.1 hypothetical protein F1188_04375 [Roseospira marina]MBB4312657.1 hypothetical protein [Roseospira marina]MBB5086570.1 hypothetical protein [Roseospira marina]
MHPENEEAVRLWLLAQREWDVSPMTGMLMRWDMVAAESVWRMAGYPVGNGRLARHVAGARAIADAYIAEANRLTRQRQERDRDRRRDPPVLRSTARGRGHGR